MEILGGKKQQAISHSELNHSTKQILHQQKRLTEYMKSIKFAIKTM